MYITINDEKFPKDDLINLIAQNKLQAIIHIRNIVNIGLHDAKEIVEHLEENPNYYDNSMIKIAEREFVEQETVTLDLKDTTIKNVNQEKKDSPHVIKHVIEKENTNNKWLYVLASALIIALLFFLMTE